MNKGRGVSGKTHTSQQLQSLCKPAQSKQFGLQGEQ